MTTLVFAAHATGDHQLGYSAAFPDLPGVTAQGADLAGLMAGAREQVLAALQRLADEGADWPSPTPVENAPAPPGAVTLLIDVPVEDTPLRVNISMGERLLKRIDQAAEARGMSRSAFIAAASRAALGDRPGWTGELDAVARKLQDEWSELGRRLTDSLAPNSPLNRNMAAFDAKVTEAIRRAADGVSASLARRGDPEPVRPADGPEQTPRPVAET